MSRFITSAMPAMESSAKNTTSTTGKGSVWRRRCSPSEMKSSWSRKNHASAARISREIIQVSQFFFIDHPWN